MNAFKRGKKGYASIYVPTRHGGLVQRSCGTGIPAVVRGMTRMVTQLKDERRWTILDALFAKRIKLPEVYDAHTAGQIDALEARLSSANLSEHLDAWIAWVRGNRHADVRTADVYWQQVTTLIVPEVPFPSSELTKARVIAWLSSRGKASSGTKRKYLYALKSFVRYLSDVGALATDPLAGLKAPKKDPARKRWVKADVDTRIVEASSDQYRALFAFIKSTGCDVSAALRAQLGDVNLFAKTTDVRGTKTDRRHVHAASIEPWAIRLLLEHLRRFKNQPAHTLLFPGLQRSAATQHHTRVCVALGVLGYTLKDSRHSIGVRMRKAGKSFEEIAAQLGTSVYQAVTVYSVYTLDDAVITADVKEAT
jgi:integrase